MPAFTTPEPIEVRLELNAGDVQLAASDRQETVVEVTPHDADKSADVKAAAETRVELSNGRLMISTPRGGLAFARKGHVNVQIGLPEGSSVDGHSGYGNLAFEGTLADCSLRCGAGSIRLGHTGSVRLVSGAGDIELGHVDGDASIITGSGAIRVAAIERAASIKSGNGSTRLGTVGGDAKVTGANGDIEIERAEASVVVKTANGNVRVGAVTRGAAELKTATGNIEIGIAEGSAGQARRPHRLRVGRSAARHRVGTAVDRRARRGPRPYGDRRHHGAPRSATG